MYKNITLSILFLMMNVFVCVSENSVDIAVGLGNDLDSSMPSENLISNTLKTEEPIYDLGSSSPLANLFSQTSSASSKIEVPTIVEKPKEKEKLVLRQEVRADWPNYFAQLCDKQANEWQVKDLLLEHQLKFALMNDEAFRLSLIEIRKNALSVWDAWYAADDKTTPRQKLARAVENLIKKMPGNHEVLAKWIIDADLAGSPEEFRKVMVQDITALPAYHFLLLSFLGYQNFSSQICRSLNNTEYSDQDARNTCMAFLVAAYRSEYDAQYPAAFEAYARIPFMRQFGLDGKAMVVAEKAEYLRTETPSSFPHIAEWQQMITLARGKAHDAALQLVKTILEKMRMTCVLFQARLEALRVSDAQFQYTDSMTALSEEQYYSFLLGVMCRVGQRMLMGREDLINSAMLQDIMMQEYKDQVSFGRMSMIPAGEKKSSAAQRKSFEARIALLIGSIDFLFPAAFDLKTKNALIQYKVEKAAELYKKIALVSAYVNGVRWGISPESASTYKAFTQTLQITRGYIESTLQLPVKSKDLLKDTYTEVLGDAMSSGVGAKFSSRALVPLGNLIQPQQQALYKFLWMQIGTRLFSQFNAQKIMSVNENALVTSLQSADSNDASTSDSQLTNMNSTSQSDYLAVGELPQAIVDSFDESDSPGRQVLRDAHENFSRFGQRMTHRAESVAHNIKKGTRQDVAMGLTDALSDTGDFINGLQEIIHNMYIQSDRVYGRMNATFKALTLYTYHLNEYATKKITNYKKVVDDMVNSLAGKLGMPVVKYFVEKAARDARITANQDEDRLKRQLDGAFTDLKLAMTGKKTVDDLPQVPLSSTKKASRAASAEGYDVGAAG